jgi:heme a synthase
VIYIAILWTALRLGENASEPPPSRFRTSAIALLILVLAQIYLGALVAGLRAGYIYNTWPLIDGAFIPEASRLFSLVPAWRNFFENTLTVQFDHRMIAYTIWLFAAWHLVDVLRARHGRPALIGAAALFLFVTIQAALGITTLLLVVPLPLALLHQTMAMIVLTIAVMHAEKMTRQPAQSTFGAVMALPSSTGA